MNIGVTSENKLKVDAVRGAYAFLSLDAIIMGYATASGVGEQPINDAALEGARNRISDLQAKITDLDRIVSIESGIFETGGQWIDKAVVVIVDSSGKEHIGYSDGIVFPTPYVEQARKRGFDKTTVGQVMFEAGYIQYAKDPHISITGKTRRKYIEETLVELVRQIEDTSNK